VSNFITIDVTVKSGAFLRHGVVNIALTQRCLLYLFIYLLI